MLSKKYRLPVNSTIGKSGKSLKSRYFLLKIFSNSSSFNRFGVVISKKVAKKAVDRNRFKRAVYDFVKQFLFSGEKRDFVLILLPQAGTALKDDFLSDLSDIIGKAIA